MLKLKSIDNSKLYKRRTLSKDNLFSVSGCISGGGGDSENNKTIVASSSSSNTNKSATPTAVYSQSLNKNSISKNFRVDVSGNGVGNANENGLLLLKKKMEFKEQGKSNYEVIEGFVLIFLFKIDENLIQC